MKTQINMFNSFRLKNCWLLLGLITFLFYFHIPFIRNFILLLHNCVDLDFAIYQQSIYDSFYLLKANPYNSYLEEYILQVHFDPVYMIAAPFAALFNYSSYSLLLFEYLTLVATIAVVYYYSKTTKQFLFFFALIALSRIIPHSYGYPIHVTTWSILPMTLLAISIKNNKTALFWIAAISLMFFKEVFPFAVMGLGLGYLISSSRKRGFILIVLSVIFCIFNFGLRDELLNSTYRWDLAGDFMANIHWFIKQLFSTDNLLKWLYALMPPITIILYLKYKKLLNKTDHLLLCFWIPLLLIHVLHSARGYHYEVLFSFLPIFLLYDKWHTLSKHFIACILLLQFCSSVPQYFRLGSDFLKERYVLTHGGYCTVDCDKRKAVRDLQQAFLQIPDTARIFIDRGTVARVLRPNLNIHEWPIQPDKYNVSRNNNYDYIVLGKTDGYHANQKYKASMEVVEKCKGVNIIDNYYYLLVKGPFDKACIDIL